MLIAPVEYAQAATKTVAIIDAIGRSIDEAKAMGSRIGQAMHGSSEADGQWWVLDYKSTSQPQLQRELCEQLWTYRTAVAQAQPGRTVRAAFLTAQGTLIELQAP